jgi:gliding motility-associated-like protein
LKKSLLIVVVLLLIIFSCARVRAQGSTSKGTEFWTCWMDHINPSVTVGNAAPSYMILYITSDIATSGTVDFTDGTASMPFTVVPNTVTFVQIPTNQFLASEGQFKKGIHITALKPIAVYAHIYASSVSGATLLLPVNTMGKSYTSLNYTQISNTINPNTGANADSYSTFAVIATEDATTVEITPTALLTSNKPAGTPFTIVLNKGDVYQGLSLTDLTGTKIRSISTATEPCKKIAVFSGSTKLGIGCVNPNVNPSANSLSADNLFQQVYPTSTWGKNYITVSLKSRRYDIYRIVLSDPNTVVTLNGNVIPITQFTNNIYDFTSTGVASNFISADKPIQVVQYTPTQGQQLNVCPTPNNPPTDTGDPEMIYLTPIEQGLNHVTLYSTGYYNIVQSYINVVIPTSAAPSFTIDGTAYNAFTPVTSNPGYSFAQISVTSGPRAIGNSGTITSGTHNLSASEPFNAIAYGFGGTESYGYAAGTNLKNLNEFIELKNPVTNNAGASGCVSVAYRPQITIPYETTKISWDFKDNKPPVVDVNPVFISQVTKGNQTLYTYQYPTDVTYTAAGNYTIVATVVNPTTDDCGSNEDIEFDYTISDIPNTKFTASSLNICPGAEVSFADITNINGIATKTWSWDFGDAANATAANPNTATNANPKHIYTIPGDYKVTLTVENQNGCATTSPEQIIHVNKMPIAGFGFSTPDCETRNVTFTDASAANEGTLTTWLWDFGDGTNPVTRTDNLPFTHPFAAAGNYNVSLTVTSNTGCVSDIKTIPIIIHALPVVDFILPDVCLSDAFAQFTNKTTIADGSDLQLTYAWDFGDAANATATNPNTSPLVSPKHKYTKVGVYTVTLTVTSNHGCIVTKSQQFTVNGDTPNAAFSVNNLGNTYCSSEDVLFKDNSTVNFGNVTKLVWYFDYNNNPTQSTVYTKDQFPADGIFHHNYGLFNTPATKSYAVKLEAYSGGTCVSVTGITNITVFANPSITVDLIAPLCQEAPPVQIKTTVLYGVGTGIFSGTGVSSDGLFDPAVSGPGTFTIDYLFTITATGCTYGSSQQITVYPTPKANAGPALRMLDGGYITLNATASGVQPLTYKWTLANGSKAIGLDHDDVLTPVASPNNDVTYMLTVTSADGCSVSSNVDITVLKAPVVPNTFTPNSDGTNDRWEIKYLDTYPNCSIEIYNRYGEKLYSSIGYPLPWDGTYKGADLPVGTYYYIINPKNGRKVITGSVTIIR